MNYRRSDIEVFLRCRRKWWYQMGVPPEDSSQSAALRIGTAVDLGQQTFYQLHYSDGMDFEEARAAAIMAARAASFDNYAEGRLGLTETEALLSGNLVHYWADEDVKWDIASVENQRLLEVEMPTGDMVHCTLDNIFTLRNGQRVLGENKTSGSTDHARLDLDFQLHFYWWMCYEARLDLDAIWYTILLKVQDPWKSKRDVFQRIQFPPPPEASIRRFGQHMVTLLEEMKRVREGGFRLAIQSPNPIPYADFGSCTGSCRFYDLCDIEWNVSPVAHDQLLAMWKGVQRAA